MLAQAACGLSQANLCSGAFSTRAGCYVRAIPGFDNHNHNHGLANNTGAERAYHSSFHSYLMKKLTQSAMQPLAPDLTALERIRQTFAQPVLASFVAGGVAGAVSRTVVSPLERLKILFQVQSVGREEYKMSVPKALAKMWREEGWRGFMAGNGTNCIRIVPYSAVQFSAYNVYKRVSGYFLGRCGVWRTFGLRSRSFWSDV